MAPSRVRIPGRVIGVMLANRPDRGAYRAMLGPSSRSTSLALKAAPEGFSPLKARKSTTIERIAPLEFVDALSGIPP